jgi:hypothetical protein
MLGEYKPLGTVPEAYYEFVMDYAPYVYVIPPSLQTHPWGEQLLLQPSP